MIFITEPISGALLGCAALALLAVLLPAVRRTRKEALLEDDDHSD